MLSLSGVHKSYEVGRNRVPVLQGIDLDIAAGELATIMGPSGSGKSTLMNVIGLMDDYDAGEYVLDGMVMQGLGEGFYGPINAAVPPAGRPDIAFCLNLANSPPPEPRASSSAAIRPRWNLRRV